MTREQRDWWQLFDNDPYEPDPDYDVEDFEQWKAEHYVPCPACGEIGYFEDIDDMCSSCGYSRPRAESDIPY